ncbi:folate-sensitive fragile site protein Fra10Ac1-domain-containing protein [Roridomyces roridus]|uniref:Folate-sensitive fragile site protein Fra10Ac1-domain-containing protein n=1 Tax=Roridomyces roridus TaxID=1738132 RepID=A0AAD7G0R8_9AGAR|nr:folate-sensitive fragile site protein Fra10Ac1-domain-containing protein [Roridomyces roridus]
MSLYPRRPPSPPAAGKSEFEILKASHKFLREDEDDKAPGSSSWDDQLATKYYDSLFREFAVCDLKHYKSGNFALRWRTEEEVLAAAHKAFARSAWGLLAASRRRSLKPW